MTVGDRRLKSEVASVELSLRKVRGLLWGIVSDMVVLVLVGVRSGKMVLTE